MALSPKQQRFADEYLIDLNATQAYIRAGYSTDGANTAGSKLLANHRIRAYVDEKLAERSKRTGISQNLVLRELARIAFVNTPDVINTMSATVKDDASEDDTACIVSVKVKTVKGKTTTSVEREIKLADKVKALELLGKHLGMFKIGRAHV